MSDTSPLLVSKLTKRYGRARGIEDVSFEIAKGEVFGFLGPNGAGKTTTIRTILNFMKPTNGLVTIFGLDSHLESIKVKRHVGYLAGDFAAYESMTGQQFLTFLGSLNQQVDAAYVDDLAKRLRADLNRPIGELSKGNRQKIGLIQAFMHKPDLLILDEPTSGLDPLMQEQFYELLNDARARGASVLFSSHNLTEVQRVCDRAAFIRDGKLIAVQDVRMVQSLNVHRFTVTFVEKVPATAFEHVEGVEEAKISGRQGTFTISGSVDAFIKALARHHVQAITQPETNLEDIFMRYYEQKDQA